MISFIVPAHNEQACLGRTLQAIHDSARAVGQEYEIIVVNDASTDATAEIGRKYGAAVLTSGRRFRRISGLQMLAGGARMLLSPLRSFTQRSSVEKVWYDSDRAADDTMPDSIAARISNGIMLMVLIVLFTEPIWSFVPWSLTPLASPLGKIRITIVGILCHVGLLFWPVSLLLLVNLLRQKRPTSLVQSSLLIAFCGWQAWGASCGLYWIWTGLFHWLVFQA
jgi:hypothetical protein